MKSILLALGLAWLYVSSRAAALFGVLSQRLYPGAGDIDDCWVVATVWAAKNADRHAPMPSVTEFRALAGNPDDPNRPDGGNLDQIARAIPRIWPWLRWTKLETREWAAFELHLDRGETASVALLSSRLPAEHRYGFNAAHQVGVAKSAGVFYIANPLAPDGSAPKPISESALRYAVEGFSNGWIMAACFARATHYDLKVRRGLFWRYRLRWGAWSRSAHVTGGFTAIASRPFTAEAAGKTRTLVRVHTGSAAGTFMDRESGLVTLTARS